VEGQLGSKTSCPKHAPPLLRTQVRRISGRVRSGASRHAFTSVFKELDPIPQFRATGQVGRIPEGSVLTIVLACSLPTSRIYRRSYCAKRTPQAPRSERSLWASSCIKPNDPSQKALAVNALSRAALRMSGVWQISKLRHVEARPSNDRHPVVTAR